MTIRYLYPVDLETDEDGRVVARLPDLAGCVTDGGGRADALRNAADALEEWLAHSILAGELVPTAAPARGRPCVAPGAVIAAKAALCDAMRAASWSKTELARRLEVGENEARRMLDPRHATKIGRMEDALALLGKRLIISVDAA